MTGLFPSICGSLVLGATSGFALASGTRIVAERLGVSKNSVVRAAKWGGLTGLAAGIAGGAVLSAQTASPEAAIALGAVGAIAGFLTGMPTHYFTGVGASDQ